MRPQRHHPDHARSDDYVPSSVTAPRARVLGALPYDAADYGPVATSPPTSTTATRRTTPRRPRCGRNCARRLPRRPLRPLRRHVGAADARHRPRRRLRHRELHQPRRGRDASAAPATSRCPAPIGGAPPITSDPPFHSDGPSHCCCRAFAPKQIEPWEPEIRRLCQRAARRDGRRSRPARPSSTPRCSTPRTSRSTSSAACSASPPRTRTCSASSCHDVLERITEEPEARATAFDDLGNYIHRPGRRTTATTLATTSPATCSTSRSTAQLDQRRHRRRDDRAAARRRHRHHVVGDRVVAVAPRPAPRRPSAPRRRSRGDDIRARGVPPRVRAGHHGAHGRQGHRLPRLPDEEGRLGAAAVPGRQPRSAQVRGSGHVHHRPRRRTATRRSGSASTAASARTSPGSS